MDGADQLWVDNLNLHSSSVDNSCFFLFFFPSLECFREHYRATSLHRISVLRHWWSFFLFLVFPTDRNVVQGPTGCNCLTQVCKHSFYRVYCVGWGNYIMMQRVEILFTLVSPFFCFFSFLYAYFTPYRVTNCRVLQSTSVLFPYTRQGLTVWLDRGMEPENKHSCPLSSSSLWMLYSPWHHPIHTYIPEEGNPESMEGCQLRLRLRLRLWPRHQSTPYSVHSLYILRVLYRVLCTPTWLDPQGLLFRSWRGCSHGRR